MNPNCPGGVFEPGVDDARVKSNLVAAGIDMAPAYKRMHDMIAVKRLEEALRMCLEALEKHDEWCGHNEDAPGNGIVWRAEKAARAALAPSPPVTGGSGLLPSVPTILNDAGLDGQSYDAVQAYKLGRDAAWSKAIGSVIGYDAEACGAITPEHMRQLVADFFSIHRQPGVEVSYAATAPAVIQMDNGSYGVRVALDHRPLMEGPGGDPELKE